MKKLTPYFLTANGVFMVLAIIGLSVVGSTAQSGRSVPKRPQTVPVSTPEPTPIPKQKPTPEFIVKVIANIWQDSYYAFPFPEKMHPWVLERLRKTSLLDVRNGGKATRPDAIKQAKAETEIYIVLLELDDDPMGRPDIAGRPAAGQSWISVSIYLPSTGKLKASKRIILNEELRRNTNVPPPIVRACHPGIYGNDALLLEASIKAAEYVMSSFNIPIPPGCPSNNPI